MTLRLFSPDPAAPPPRPVVLELSCDGDHVAPVRARFEQDGFIAQYAAAMKAGWLDRQETVFCPECSGKSNERAEARRDPRQLSLLPDDDA